MSKYVLRRILIAFPLILAVTTVVFVMLRVALPGDPAKLMAGDRASPEQVEIIRRKLGLDRPVIEQYLIFLRNFAQGDLGRSVKFREPVLRVIAKALSLYRQDYLAQRDGWHGYRLADRYHDGSVSAHLD